MHNEDTLWVLVIGLIIAAVVMGAIFWLSRAADALPSPTPTVKCPHISNFKPKQIITIPAGGKTYVGETVLMKDGCPALLVLIPIDKDLYGHIKAKPTPTPNGR